MADTIEIKVSSNGRQILSSLEKFSAEMGAAIARALDLENQFSIEDMSLEKLSKRGPKTLGVVTNRLRSSINATRAVATGTTVESAIGTNVVYAGAHEFGFRGTVQVRAHQRRLLSSGRGGERVQVQKVKFLRRDGKIVEQRTSKSRKLVGTVQVKAHSRQMSLPERSYLRSTIRERAPNYSKAIGAAIVGAWEGNS